MNKRIKGLVASAALAAGLGLFPCAALADVSSTCSGSENSSLAVVSVSNTNVSDSIDGQRPAGSITIGEYGSGNDRIISGDMISSDIGKDSQVNEQLPEETVDEAVPSTPSAEDETDVPAEPDIDASNAASQDTSAPKDGTYSIGASAAPGKTVDVPGGSASGGQSLQSWSSNGTDAQVWRTETGTDGLTTIYHASSNLALDVYAGHAFEGAKVQLWSANGTLAQKWVLIADGSFFKIASALDRSFVLDLRGASTNNGAVLQLWSDNGTVAQRWSFSEATTVRQRADALARDNSGAIADGTYTLGSIRASGKAMDVVSGQASSGTRVQSWSANGTDAQVWTVSHDSNGYVTFTMTSSGKALDVKNGCASAQTQLQLWDSNGTYAQKWVVVPCGDGSYKLLSALDSSLTIDVMWGSAENGTKLWLYGDNGSDAQKWSFSFATTQRMRLDSLAAANHGVLSDGDYGIRSELIPTIVVDVRGGNTSSGAVAQTYTANGTAAQLWSVLHDSKGYLTFISKKTGKALDVCNGSAFGGAKVQLYSPNGTFAQKWIAVPCGSSFKLISALDDNLALDIPGASLSDSMGLQLYRDNGTSAQHWSFSNANAQDIKSNVSFFGNSVIPKDIYFGDKFIALPSAAKVTDVDFSFSDDVFFGDSEEHVAKGSTIKLSELLGSPIEGLKRLVLFGKDGREIQRLFIAISGNINAMFLKSDDPTSHGREWVESSPNHTNAAKGSLSMYAVDGGVIYDGKLSQIKGRGNSTWGLAKKPYQIKLDKKTDLLQSGTKDNKAKTWVLLSDGFDDSSSRSAIAYKYAQLLGVKSAVEFSYVDLFYDGEYRGTYLLSEKVQVNKGRVDIENLEDKNADLNPGIESVTIAEGNNSYGLAMRYAKDMKSPEDITGGYLIEHEVSESRYMQEYAWFSVSTKTGVQHFVCKSPEIWSFAEADYMSCLMQDLFDAFANGGVVPSWRNSARAGLTTSDLLDVDSLARIYWLNEIFKNPDGYTFSSGYLYKDSDSNNGKIEFGPAWDFDLSAGNSSNNIWDNPVVRYEGWYTRSNGLGISFMSDPYVSSAINKSKDEVIQALRSYLNDGELDADMKSVSDSLRMDSFIWGRQGESYTDVRSWLNARLDWIESN